jgi:hypothetical protein
MLDDEPEPTNTNVSSLSDVQGTMDSSVSGVPRQHPLPWVLFGVAALLLALIGGLLAKRLNMESKRVNAEVEHSEQLEVKLRAAEAAKVALEKRALDAESARADAEKGEAELSERVKKLEADKAAADKKPDPPPPPEKKPKKKQKKRHH